MKRHSPKLVAAWLGWTAAAWTLGFCIGLIHHLGFYPLYFHGDAAAKSVFASAILAEANPLPYDFAYSTGSFILEQGIFVALLQLLGFGLYNAFALGSALSLGVWATVLVLDQTDSSLAIVRYPTRFMKLAGSLGMRDEHLFPSGSLLYWEATDFRRSVRKPLRGIEVFNIDHGAGVSDARRIITDSFAGYLNHYSSNPGLDSNLVAAGYAEWAVTSLARPSNKLFVLRDRGVSTGAAVVVVTGDMWEIELAGIATTAQGKGRYPILLGAVVDASRRIQSRLVISTQAHNTRAQKIWAELGFVPINSFDTVHLARRGVYRG